MKRKDIEKWKDEIKPGTWFVHSDMKFYTTCTICGDDQRLFDGMCFVCWKHRHPQETLEA